MSTVGALAPDIPDRGPTVFAVTTATLVLATVFVSARLYSRWILVGKVGLDDHFMTVAWLLAFGLSFSIDYAVRMGLGRHDINISEENLDSLRKAEYVFSVLYNPALMATKSSILLFFLRMSKNTQSIMRRVSWILLGIIVAAGTILTFLNIFQCHPVQATFQPMGGAQCISLLTEFICAAPINIITDLAILALPIPILTGMTLPPRQKYILIFTFALWIFVTIVDVVRVYYLQKAVGNLTMGATSTLFGGEEDFAWNASLSLMWSAVEVNIGITCACIPTLKNLITKILPESLIDSEKLKGLSNNMTRETSYMTENGTTRWPTSPLTPIPLLSPSPTSPTVVFGGSRGRGPRDQRASIVSFRPTGPSITRSNTYHSPSNGFDQDDEYRNFMSSLATTSVPRRSARRATALSTVETIATMNTAPTRRESRVYFGFVNMKRPKTMLHVSATDSFKYCTFVTILFLLWGISYGFLYTLNNAVASVGDMTVAQTLGLTSAYFGGGYLLGPLLVGEWILRHDEHRRTSRRKSSPAVPQVGGFKATFIIGLCIYGIGTITFWPSAVLSSFPGFMFSHFVVGFGLAVLETGANPFIALCGPTEYSEMRLLLSQGVQGVGAVSSGLIAQKVFFKDLGSRENAATTLIDVQWTYLAITLFCVFLALFFYYMPLPELPDSDLEEETEKILVDPKKRHIGGLSLQTWSLALAVFAQWTYMAAQESVNIYFHGLMTQALNGNVSSSESPLDGIFVTEVGAAEAARNKAAGMSLAVSDYLLIAHSTLAVSRFAVGYLAYLSPTKAGIPEPRTILLISTVLAFIFGTVATLMKTSDPRLLAIPTTLFFLAEGPIWPLVFALGLRGQGTNTKRAAAFITMGGSGPAFFPFVIYGILKAGAGIRTAFIVVVVLLACSCTYGIWLHLAVDAKLLVDPPLRHPEAGRRKKRRLGSRGSSFTTGSTGGGSGGGSGATVIVEEEGDEEDGGPMERGVELGVLDGPGGAGGKEGLSVVTELGGEGGRGLSPLSPGAGEGLFGSLSISRGSRAGTGGSFGGDLSPLDLKGHRLSGSTLKESFTWRKDSGSRKRSATSETS